MQKNLPDTTELVKHEFQRLNAALNSSQRKITWKIYEPISHRELYFCLVLLFPFITTFIITMIAMYLMQDRFIISEQMLERLFERRLNFSIIFITMVFVMGLIVAGYDYYFLFFKPKKMHYPPVKMHKIVLNLDKQKASIKYDCSYLDFLDFLDIPSYISWIKYQFNSQNTLPAFLLPEAADDDLCRLRDDVQNRITQITGLNFE